MKTHVCNTRIVGVCMCQEGMTTVKYIRQGEGRGTEVVGEACSVHSH